MNIISDAWRSCCWWRCSRRHCGRNPRSRLRRARPKTRSCRPSPTRPTRRSGRAMLEEFVQKFSSNPAAVAYGNWQLAQQYVAAGDPQKALAYGDQALAAMPDVVEILVSQIDVAQQLKDSSKVVDYAVRGATVIDGIGKKPKPAEMSAGGVRHPGCHPEGGAQAELSLPGGCRLQRHHRRAGRAQAHAGNRKIPGRFSGIGICRAAGRRWRS